MRYFIDLIRHGEPVGGRMFRGAQDDPLSETGWRQMEEAADMFGGEWQQVITSPLIRCRGFAEKIADKMGIGFTVDQGFHEVTFGQWEGCTIEKINQKWPDKLEEFWQNPFSFTPPGGEPFTEFEKRIEAAWQTLISNLECERTLLVAHSGVIRMVLSKALGLPAEHMFNIQVPYACISRLEIHPRDNQLPTCTLISHHPNFAGDK